MKESIDTSSVKPSVKMLSQLINKPMGSSKKGCRITEIGG